MTEHCDERSLGTDCELVTSISLYRKRKYKGEREAEFILPKIITAVNLPTINLKANNFRNYYTILKTY